MIWRISDCSEIATQIMTYRLGRPVLTSTNRLPCGGAALKVPESLGELKRLNDDTLFLLIVPELGVSSQGEVLAQWVAVKAVVGHDASQIGVVGEEDTEHVIDLTLVPQSALEQTSYAGHRGGLVGVGLDTDAGVVANTEQVVNDLETLVPCGEVNTGDIGDLGEFGRSMVLEEAHHGNDTGGGSVDGELVLPHGELLDVFGKAGHDVLSIGVQAVGHVLVLVGRVDDGGAEGSLG